MKTIHLWGSDFIESNEIKSCAYVANQQNGLKFILRRHIVVKNVLI